MPSCPVRDCHAETDRAAHLCDGCFKRLPRTYAEPLCQSASPHRNAMLLRAVAFLNRFGRDERAFRSKAFVAR